MKLAIVVPVKSPRRAKQRLEAVLTEPDRERLAATMARWLSVRCRRLKFRESCPNPPLQSHKPMLMIIGIAASPESPHARNRTRRR